MPVSVTSAGWAKAMASLHCWVSLEAAKKKFESWSEPTNGHPKKTCLWEVSATWLIGQLGTRKNHCERYCNSNYISNVRYCRKAASSRTKPALCRLCRVAFYLNCKARVAVTLNQVSYQKRCE